jgi:hypothetical protein
MDLHGRRQDGRSDGGRLIPRPAWEPWAWSRSQPSRMSNYRVLPPEWGWSRPIPRKYAIKTLSRFGAIFAGLIVAELSCFEVRLQAGA